MTQPLGSTYLVGTNVPLLPQVRIDVPVGEVARDAIRSQIPLILAITLGSALVGSLAANLIVSSASGRG